MQNMTFGFAAPDRRDELTDEERAAIDAFPQERIQRIPVGVSGEPATMPSLRTPEGKARGIRMSARRRKFQALAKRREDAELNRVCDDRKDGPFVEVSMDVLGEGSEL